MHDKNIIRIGDDVTLHTGDALETLRALPDESVQTCVTSPPYFGLRDYGTAEWVGGDENCAHTGNVPRTCPAGSQKQSSNKGANAVNSGDCDCGAVRVDSQIGIENTLGEYIGALVAVFSEVNRVLRDDGTLWLNLGDSYAAQRGGTHQPAETLAGGKSGKTENGESVNRGRSTWKNPTRNASALGFKHKDLIGVPWRVAMALQDAGWYLRQDIIWHKPNPMPESVKDRCTKAHEYIFLLTKSAKYYFDQPAIAEESNFPRGPGNKSGYIVAGEREGENANIGGAVHKIGARETRNKRSVWSVSPAQCKEAHFATYPPELITPCVMAGAPAGGVVLDPFSGSGTTGMVALQQGRKYIGIELNHEYQQIAIERIKPAAAQARLFA